MSKNNLILPTNMYSFKEKEALNDKSKTAAELEGLAEKKKTEGKEAAEAAQLEPKAVEALDTLQQTITKEHSKSGKAEAKGTTAP